MNGATALVTVLAAKLFHMQFIDGWGGGMGVCLLSIVKSNHSKKEPSFINYAAFSLFIMQTLYVCFCCFSWTFLRRKSEMIFSLFSLTLTVTLSWTCVLSAQPLWWLHMIYASSCFLFFFIWLETTKLSIFLPLRLYVTGLRGNNKLINACDGGRQWEWE